MKNVIIIAILFSWFLMSCSSSLSVVQLNDKFVKSEKPLSDWDKDLLNTRNKVFKQLNISFDSISSLYLIEKYDIESAYYYGLLYLNTNEYFHFCRESFNAEIKIINKGLTNTEKFIINEIKTGKLNNIKAKSKNTDVISPSSLYITIAQERTIQHVKIFRYQEFYID